LTDHLCSKVELLLGDRLEPACALWKIARPVPKILEYPDQPGVLREGDLGSAALATLSFTPHHFPVDGDQPFVDDQFVAFWAKDHVFFLLAVIPYSQEGSFYDEQHVSG